MASVDTPPYRTSGFAVADAITLARIPLAIAFPLASTVTARLVILALAAATDLGDGLVARRFGASRAGALLDPIADKFFMATAFAVVLLSGKLAWYEVTGVLARDIVAIVAFAIVGLLGYRLSVPARLGGKVVTLLQLVTLLVFVLDRPVPELRRIAWATMAVALYAIFDYTRPFFRKLAAR